MSLGSLMLLAVLPCLAILAALCDAATYQIPNRVTLAVAATFPVVAGLAGLPLETIGIGLATGLVVLAVTFLAFLRGWFGGGDAKLAAALACWFGPSAILPFAVVVSLLGGVLAIVLIAVRSLPIRGSGNDPDWLARLRDKRSGVPYGIALGFAAVLQYSQTPVWHGIVGPA